MAVMLLKLLFLFLISHVFSSHFLDQERINSTNSLLSSSPSKPAIASAIPNGNIRHPIKPRTMAQAPIPTEESASLDLSSDGDITIIEIRKIFKVYEGRGMVRLSCKREKSLLTLIFVNQLHFMTKHIFTNFFFLLCQTIFITEC